MWEDGVDVPDVDALPDLDSEDQRWLGYYRDLDPYRRTGMQAGAVPIQELVAYCRLIEYPDEQFFVKVLMAVDRRVLQESRRKANEGQEDQR